jgi:hypothetical protein
MVSEEQASPSVSIRCVDPQVVERMLTLLPGETSQALMNGFGISYNTWRKIRAGRPIRFSVAERLERRLDAGLQESQVLSEKQRYATTSSAP